MRDNFLAKWERVTAIFQGSAPFNLGRRQQRPTAVVLFRRWPDITDNPSLLTTLVQPSFCGHRIISLHPVWIASPGGGIAKWPVERRGGPQFAFSRSFDCLDSLTREDPQHHVRPMS